MSDQDFSPWFAGKDFSTDWTSHHLAGWASLLASRREQPLEVLEIGSWEGRSALFFLNFLPQCRLTCIDTFLGSAEHALRPSWAAALPGIEARFDANLAEFAGRFEKIKSPSREALAALQAARRRFDVVLIDGSHHSLDANADAHGAWPMVNAGGVVIFDDYTWDFFADEASNPKLGIDAFLMAHGGQYRELQRGYQLIIERTESEAAGE